MALAAARRPRPRRAARARPAHPKLLMVPRIQKASHCLVYSLPSPPSILV
jgi:hypothetical protein